MEDFSFPTIKTREEEPFPRFGTSQIWYRRSFSSAEEAAKVADKLSGFSPALSDTGENMDMLWEEFNDELKKKDMKHHMKSGSVEEFCVPKRKSSLRSHKKPGLIVMMKVLKKLFLVQKNGMSKKVRDVN